MGAFSLIVVINLLNRSCMDDFDDLLDLIGDNKPGTPAKAEKSGPAPQHQERESGKVPQGDSNSETRPGPLDDKVVEPVAKATAVGGGGKRKTFKAEKEIDWG